MRSSLTSISCLIGWKQEKKKGSAKQRSIQNRVYRAQAYESVKEGCIIQTSRKCRGSQPSQSDTRKVDFKKLQQDWKRQTKWPDVTFKTFFATGETVIDVVCFTAVWGYRASLIAWTCVTNGNKYCLRTNAWCFKFRGSAVSSFESDNFPSPFFFYLCKIDFLLLFPCRFFLNSPRQLTRNGSIF